ncbi:hypothetical protein [Lichenicoccus sp.]|uniref:hypothetical protein n=1 Tax=Lichenicoccus sp. TaxID=2781899 RepID=UPI003D13F886
MSGRESRPAAFVARPRDPDAWVRAPEPAAAPASVKGEVFTARLTVDVTPALRGRIKVAAFTRGLTVADMLRAMLEQAFPEPDGSAQ